MTTSSETEGLDAALAAINEDQTLGRYELLLPIGRGGMAVVWAARLRGTRGFSKIVAVKTMLPALSADPRFEKMFLAEAQISSRIKHPNVCEVLDLGEENGVLYLVMEWIAGEPVSSLLQSEPKIPCDVAAAIAAGAARGLHAAHEPFGVVHRDVSPQNILVSTDGLVKIVDFGVAKAAQRSDQNVTQSGYIKGKVAYLAPEQIRSPEIDGRTDIFALGTVLYEMTTGVHPFRGSTELDTLLRIASADVPPPLPPDYPEDLGAVVLRALAKDPADRHRSMRELAIDLEQAGASSIERVAAWMTKLTAEKREERARELEAAAEQADARDMRRRSESRRRLSVDRELASEPPNAPATSSDVARPPTSRWAIRAGVVVGVVGVGVGAFGLLQASRAARGASSEAPIVASSPAATSTTMAVSPVSTPPPASASASITPPTTTSVPSPSPPAAAMRPTTARPPSPVAATASVSAAPSGEPKTRFRQPDF